MDPSVLGEFIAAPQEDEIEEEINLEKLVALALQRGINPKLVEILRAVASGQTSATIATHYGVAERTARAWRAKAVSELRERTQCAV